MKTALCLLVASAFVSAAFAANTPAQLKEIQDVSDAFIKAAVDKDFDAFKEKASATRLAEYKANEINCPLTRYWEAARKAIDEHKAEWTFVKVKANYPTTVELVYSKKDDAGETEANVHMTKDPDGWKVDAAGGLF